MMNKDKVLKTFFLFMTLGIGATIVGYISTVVEMAVIDVPLANNILTRMAWALAGASLVGAVSAAWTFKKNKFRTEHIPAFHAKAVFTVTLLPVLGFDFMTSPKVTDTWVNWLVTFMTLLLTWFFVSFDEKLRREEPGRFYLTEFLSVLGLCAIVCYKQWYAQQEYLYLAVLAAVGFFKFAFYSDRFGLYYQCRRSQGIGNSDSPYRYDRTDSDAFKAGFHKMRIMHIFVLWFVINLVSLLIPHVQFVFDYFSIALCFYGLFVISWGSSQQGRNDLYRTYQEKNQCQLSQRPKVRKQTYIVSAVSATVILGLTTIYSGGGTLLLIMYAVLGMMLAASPKMFPEGVIRRSRQRCK